MNRGTMGIIFQRLVLINDVTSDVEDTAEDLFTNRHGDWLASVVECHTTLETFGCGHRNSAHPTVTEVLLNFESQLGVFAVEIVIDFKCVENFRQFAGFGKISVDDGADDLDDGSLVAH